MAVSLKIDIKKVGIHFPLSLLCTFVGIMRILAFYLNMYKTVMSYSYYYSTIQYNRKSYNVVIIYIYFSK
jgi:hypothetical protein